MKFLTLKRFGLSGTSLIEVVIAMGVMAVAIPLVFGALAESGKTSMLAEAETHGSWMVRQCMDELDAAHKGRSLYFPEISNHQIFPPAGEVWGLAFSSEGRLIAKFTKAEYDSGIHEIDGSKARYLLTTSSILPAYQTGQVPVLEMKITVEFPAGSPAGKRQKLDFFTHAP
jgi:type II secretory pathway pseudopilin PulG